MKPDASATLHRSVLRERVQLYPVQTELALRPPHQQLDRLASNPGAARPRQHKDAQSGTPVGQEIPTSPISPIGSPLYGCAIANQ
jgi:hypothetical protein